MMTNAPFMLFHSLLTDVSEVNIVNQRSNIDIRWWEKSECVEEYSESKKSNTMIL
jgi:hypothetical protein